MNQDQLLQAIAQATKSEDDQVVVDLRLTRGFEPRCPKLERDGNHAFGEADHLKLQHLAGGAACSTAGDGQDVETFCLPKSGTDATPDDLRAWVLPVDLRKAKTFVRNPRNEKFGGKLFP